MTIKITSSAFTNGQLIPKKYTGEGEDVSPPLAWSDLPEKTQELALICDDPDAPNGTWVHWVIYKLPADLPGLPEGVAKQAAAEEPARRAARAELVAARGRTSAIKGRCPRPAWLHHYHFTLYALEGKLVVEPGLDRNTLLREIENHVLGEGELVGTYQR